MTNKTNMISIPESEYMALFRLYIEAEQLINVVNNESLEAPVSRDVLFQQIGRLAARLDLYWEERGGNDAES